MKKGEWISSDLLREFESEGTNAHRLCTIDNGWSERFGADVLISFRKDAARDRLVTELQAWSEPAQFHIRRRKLNEHRNRKSPEIRDRFRRRLFGRVICRSKRKSSIRHPNETEASLKLLRLHLLVLSSGRVGRRANDECRPFKEIVGTRPG